MKVAGPAFPNQPPERLTPLGRVPAHNRHVSNKSIPDLLTTVEYWDTSIESGKRNKETQTMSIIGSFSHLSDEALQAKIYELCTELRADLHEARLATLAHDHETAIRWEAEAFDTRNTLVLARAERDKREALADEA